MKIFVLFDALMRLSDEAFGRAGYLPIYRVQFAYLGRLSGSLCKLYEYGFMGKRC